MPWEAWLLLLTLIVALSLLWSTVRTGMSPMPSSRAARAAMLEALQGTEGPIADLGSGWGHLAIATARQYPERTVIGYEMSWCPWLVSVLVARLLKTGNVRFHRGDAFAALARSEPRAPETLLVYLHGPGMTRLLETLEHHDTAVQWVISNTFALPRAVPERRWRLRDFHGSPIYRYRWPEGRARTVGNPHATHL